MSLRILVVAIFALLFFLTVALATDYRFHVSCDHRSYVVLWKTGDVDPGREWLRVATGTSNPDCSVSEYVASLHAGLPIETRSHTGGVIKGIPLIGSIICGIFGC